MYNQENLINILKCIQGERSLNKFAEDIKIDSAYLSRIFNYKRTNPPTPDILRKIADNSKGLTTYMELMMICGYITSDNLEEKENALKIYSLTRDLKIKIGKQMASTELTDDEKLVVKKYVDDKFKSINVDSSELQQVATLKKITNKLKNIKKIPNIDAEKVYRYCLNKVMLETGNIISFIYDADIYKNYITSDKFELYENMDSNNIDMVSEESEQYKTNTIKIPVVGTVAAGEPILAEQNIIDYEELPAEEFKDGEYFGLKIKGDSMFPRILEGDVVIVRQQSDCDNGKVAVVLINGDEATVKQIKKTKTGIMLIPFNNKYDPMFFTKEEIETKPVKIIGVVRRLIGYNFE